LASFDGSCKNGEAGSAVYMIDEDIQCQEIKARPPGEQTGAIAELHALLLLLRATPPTSPLIIFGDNLNTLSLLEGRTPTRAEEKLIVKELQRRKAYTQGYHVYSHQKEKLRENPDKWKPLIFKQKKATW
jgi:hypothetical protein